jgi:hypothetical protein
MPNILNVIYKGSSHLETYPADSGFPGYRFMGYKSVFEKAGFTFWGKAGKRRNIMSTKWKDNG